jgi:hypothetical protein
MSHPIATYSFLPWFRQGLANQIASQDHDVTVRQRASVNVHVDLSADKVGGGVQTAGVDRPVALFGPGDIVGIEARAIVRIEPRNSIFNFEPNYLPFIEFYDEDFPWRYTPAAPSAQGRLRPWIALVVLREGEFKEGRNIREKPLPYIEVADPSLFPPADELWAWAHVHVNASLAANDVEIVSTDMAAVIPRLADILQHDPDRAYARLMSPRKLGPKAAYHAFVMPVFETGRLAGLNLDAAASPHATHSAWAPYPAGTRPEGGSYPYYFRWSFSTGSAGDFESLVRLLVPKPVDKRVGLREMDTLYPGSDVRGIQNKPELKGILKLGGALRVPRKNFDPDPPGDPEQLAQLAELNMYENWDDPYPQPIEQDLAKFINLADDYDQAAAAAANGSAGAMTPCDPETDPDCDCDPNIPGDCDTAVPDPDPLITPPLYGRWHALTSRLLVERNGTPITPNHNWVHELNLDTRWRVTAGFGTRVVQDQQEKFMDAAWEQIGKVLEANERIRRGQFARAISGVWYDFHLRPLLAVSRQNALLMMAPLNKRVLLGDSTVHHTLSGSLVQPTMTSAALRRAIRPRGRLMQALPGDAQHPAGALLDRVNAGEISAAPPKVTPPGIGTVDDLANQVLPPSTPPLLVNLARRFRLLRGIIALLAALIALLALLFAPVRRALLIAAAAAGAAAAAWAALTRLGQRVAGADVLRDDGDLAAAVDAAPASPDFRLTQPGSGFRPGRGAVDSPEAARYKTALKDAGVLIQASNEAGLAPVRRPIDLAAWAGAMIAGTNPAVTVPRRVLAGIFLPPRIRLELPEDLVEVMAYPEFDTPMYEPLKGLSAELFLPNINLIEHNSITLLETNQRFIESYMVGLNHEFARELLWRQYPTDQRGSYFRQFWDVSSFFNAQNLDQDALREKLRDIPPIHTWRRASNLGEHDNRETGGQNEEEVVLVIRGELLKRYPNAVIYAHRACWQRASDGSAEDRAKDPCERSGAIDNTVERRLAPLTDAEEDSPPTSKVLTPLYRAVVDPDIYFLGFNLTVDKAVGGTGEHPTDDPGWFFVIKERPGEPRYGLDIDKQPQLQVWDDLSWEDVQPGAAGSFIRVNAATPALHLTIPAGSDDEKRPQYNDDRNVTWSRDMSAADVAYVLFQAPVLVAVHASEMLPKKKAV